MPQGKPFVIITDIKDIMTPLTWIITEGITGTENQCLGIAEALGVEAVVKRIKLNEPWKTFSPYLGFETAASFSHEGDMLTPPWPDLVIASGRKSIAASRYIKRKSKKSIIVQIQDTRTRRSEFDLLVVPEHDPAAKLNKPNIFVTTATPNRITDAKLSAAREKFAQFQSLPSPRIAVLIGGTAGKQVLTADMVKTLAEQLKALDAQGYGLMVTTSRRTGEANKQILVDELKNTKAYIWDGVTENPYFGFLAWADALIVTSESMSMLSEAGTTGKPVYMVDLGGAKPRHKQMQQNLKNKGIIRNFEGQIDEWTYKPLRDSDAVAQEIRRRFWG